MKTMTWEEIRKDWAELELRHRNEKAEAIFRYCQGHGMRELAKELNIVLRQVQDYLDLYGALQAGADTVTATAVTKDFARDQVRELVKQFAPDDEDNDGFQTYVKHYIDSGQEPETAERIARAEWAAEAGIEEGVIGETTNKRNQKVNKILFPDDPKDTFELDLKMHTARVKAAATFLSTAKVRNLRLRSTCEKVAEADAAWSEQAELVLQHYQPSEEV